MELMTLRVNSGSGFKDIAIVGEIHVYGTKESKLANELLENKKIDYGFFEGVDLAGFFGLLFTLFVRFIKLVTGRNKKTLIELAIEKNIPFKRLEKGTLPMKTRIGLSILILIFFSIVVTFIVSVFRQDWRSVAKFSIAILLGILVLRFLDYSFLSRYVPANKEERDKIMSSNLIIYIRELDFKSGLVVVGKAHFPQIVAAVRDNFESQLIEANSQF